MKWTFSIPLWSVFHPDTPYYRHMSSTSDRKPFQSLSRRHVRDRTERVLRSDPRTGHQIWHYCARGRASGFRLRPPALNRGVRRSRRSRVHVTDNAPWCVYIASR